MAPSPSVTLFGPGVGESVCIDLGNGDWAIVDSCINPETKRPAALEFLENRGVLPEEAVKLIVVSHWHDDHIRGISQTFEVCFNATLALPSAMTKEEFHTLTYAYGRQASPSDSTPSGVSEMARTMSLLKSRMKLTKAGVAVPSPRLVNDQCILYSQDNIVITSLSPSSSACLASLREFNSELNEGQRSGRVVPRPKSNMCAVALHIKFGDLSVLLGSDLETSPNQLIGWHAVLNSSVQPTPKASVVKVPHHGSVTADHPLFWSNLVDQDPVGIMTTFSPRSLPRETDIVRLKKHTRELYCTTLPKSSKLPKRDKVVEKLMEKTVKQRSLLYSPKLGRVTVELMAGGWQVTTNSRAEQL